MKNLIIAGLIGMGFMGGGFWYGLQLKPLPKPQTREEAAAAAQVAAAAAVPPISIDTLKKASESIMSLNDAIKDREAKVAAREQAVQERETELAAERAALDASHEKFKELFNEFQSRLQLVEANQVDELQKQAALYQTMGSDQSIELIKAMDDAEMTRLFSVMDTKPLSKLVADWKTKYPADIPRLLNALDAMGQVMPKDKIALNENGPAIETPSGAAPGQASPDQPTDTTAPAPAPDSTTTPPAPAPDTAAPAAAPTPAADSAPPAAPTDPNAPPPLAPPPDPTPAPVSTATSN